MRVPTVRKKQLADEFQRTGREVVLLTLREAEAISHALAGLSVPPENSNLVIARNVIRRQLEWLHEIGEPLE